MQIKIESTEEFFKRGKSIGSQADQNALVAESKIISFENAEDLASVVSPAKINLFRSVRSAPGSITEISTRLKRDRSAVKRDVDVLCAYGLLDVRSIKNAGHGLKKEVVATEANILMAW